MNELSEVLEELKKLGKITDEDIRRVSWASEKKRQVVDALHLLLCSENHDTTCTYFKEDVIDECWKLEAHQLWLKKADEICTRFGLKEEPAKMLVVIRDAMDITRSNTVQAIYLALSVLHPELLSVLPLELSLNEPVAVPDAGDVSALPPDQEIEDEQKAQDADNEESA